MGLDSLIYPKEVEGPYVILGKGHTRYDKRFNQFISCMVVLNSSNKLIRLFPIDMGAFSNFKEFEFIKVRVKRYKHEKHRPETRRIIPSSIRVTKKTFNYTLSFETGEVLHYQNWKKMKRSIALIRPQITKIKQKWNESTLVEYFCNMEGCTGHKNKVDAYTFEQLSALNQNKESLGFVLGTHGKYPYRWMLISVIPVQP
ncbi:MAG: hypothetical protein ACXADY_02215 [Candidatus Hodarchaeales archaeon]|jgi:hypothetical protein